MTATRAAPEEIPPENIMLPVDGQKQRIQPARRRGSSHTEDGAEGRRAERRLDIVDGCVDPTPPQLGDGPPQFDPADYIDRPVVFGDVLDARIGVLVEILAMQPLEPAADPQVAERRERLRLLLRRADPGVDGPPGTPSPG